MFVGVAAGKMVKLGFEMKRNAQEQVRIESERERDETGQEKSRKGEIGHCPAGLSLDPAGT